MELYHLVSRGVDGRDIFLDSQDYARFVHDLYEFNDIAPATVQQRRTAVNVRRSTSYMQRERSLIVDIHAWCLMRNHTHLLVSERVDGGLTLFLRKMSGYGRYFNERHERYGVLLQKTKKILIERDVHCNYILHYIHLNPLDYLAGAKGWRERDKGAIYDVEKALKHLEKYRWSSFLDYCGKENFPSAITTSFFGGLFPNYRKTITDYLRERTETELEHLNLE